jgi:cytochrome c551/c552
MQNDTTVIAQNVVSVSDTLAIFNKYSQASGAENHLNKTIALVINGVFKPSLLPPNISVVDTAKICDVHFGKHSDKKNEEMLRTKYRQLD